MISISLSLNDPDDVNQLGLDRKEAADVQDYNKT